MSSDLPPTTKSWLVEQAEQILEEQILEAMKSDRELRAQTAQLRNLLQIVQTESEIPVLRNFIRYQTGRKATKKFWGLIHTEVLRVLAEIGERFPDGAARRLALQSFFGYLVRHYVYLNEALQRREPARAARGAGR